MDFTRRYLLWITAPSTAVTLPASFIFLGQVIQLSPAGIGILIALFVALYAGATATLYLVLTRYARRVESAAGSGEDVSTAMSECLRRTTQVAVFYWTVAGALFAVAGTLLIRRAAMGFAYFLIAALIAAFPSMLWSYAGAKRQLANLAATLTTRARYVGRETSFRRKVAITFIGSFILSAIVLVELVSSKVETTLEALAVSTAAERFNRLLDSANVMARVDDAALSDLKQYIPPDYAIYLIRPDGNVAATGDPLPDADVAAIRRIGTGDSTSYVGTGVTKFARLRDGSILALSIPWTPYENIPRQVRFYTIIVALITAGVFTLATLLLARDVTFPLHQLRDVAREMASGDFESPTHVFSDDEVGHLASSFDETRINLSRLLGRIGGSGTTITNGVRVITGGTDSLVSRSRNQAELTEHSSVAVENVRQGIGSVLGAAQTVTELTQESSARSVQLQSAAEEIARNMDTLFQSVEKTSASVTEMNATMAEMSRRTDVLAGIGDEVLSFVAEMQSTIDELRATSQSTADISRQVREDAQAGGKAVGRTVDGINATEELTYETAKVVESLQKSVAEISRILNVIEEITGRTNLLALNAAIIAAQAGEHGQGFSVVADEIRELAERTKGSTKEISEIVKAVQGGSREAVNKIGEGVKRVGENVHLAREAAQSLDKIVGSANRSSEMATRISAALEEQSRASKHLHEVTSRMSDHIAEINRATREQARGTQLLAQEAELVRDIAAQVKSASDEQSSAGRGITQALERIAEDARQMRDLLERQLQETDRIADAARVMLNIAQQNDAIARDFNEAVQSLVRSGQDFDAEVSRFKFK
jgi:methyl-accepting chemotaxis protein